MATPSLKSDRNRKPVLQTTLMDACRRQPCPNDLQNLGAAFNFDDEDGRKLIISRAIDIEWH